ncbi:membrane-associated protein, putative [Bodo saltans]|uniref:Membrane-associated protein, putative n=1 Tax=Bodo saltans TaxID=75058 RepID=A0A0S4J167_BODSA|nr:membrane-associated protein, putative [Bodo saltans]|eukprot:CUG47540.1 membrane-associated protein, putative [Bodo saltans]
MTRNTFFVVALVATILAANTVAAHRSSADAVKSSTTDGCINNITNGIEQVLAAAKEIGTAIVDCGAHQTDKCVADIAQTGADIAGAATDVSNAVSACGGQGSLCVTQLLQLSKDLAESGNEIALAAGLLHQLHRHC